MYPISDKLNIKKLIYTFNENLLTDLKIFFKEKRARVLSLKSSDLKLCLKS
jgi:hypothetical protein